jgi:transcriptional regulator with XRE-family HTH domain
MSACISPARLRAARESVGLSRERAAIAVGRSWRSISNYESGRGVPSAPVLIALAELYGVAVEDLLDTSTAAAAS